MRVTSAHLEQLRAAIAPYDTEARRTQYRSGSFARAELVKDLDKRYRWDLYWHAVRMGNSLPDSTQGYNDSHVDTALRSIVKPL